VKIRVYYEDTDLGGIVYHPNFIKFCERDRSEYFFQKGGTPHFEGGGFVVVKIEADFKAPARLGDLLEVKSDVVSVKGTSLVLKQEVLKEDILLFSMVVKLAFVKDEKVGRMPLHYQEYLLKLFSQAL